MRVVIQRVTKASVQVNEEVVGQIGKGLLCLVGIHQDDQEEDLEYCCRKLLRARIWPNADSSSQWQTSVLDNNYSVLLVSQFTLYGSLKKNKPDFHVSMSPSAAEAVFNKFVEKVRVQIKDPAKVQLGKFAAYMDVNLNNDGPVTLIIDSKNRP